MSVALPREKMSVPEFLAWWEGSGGDERFELVDGRVVAMSRDRASHNRAKMRAATLLAEAIRSAGIDCEAFVDGMGVSPDRYNYRIPDAVVQCGKVDADALILDRPVIVVEVVSPSSEERDVHAKLRDYFAIPSVDHYLIVYDDRRFLVHHRRGQGGAIETTFVSQGPLDLVPPGIRLSAEAFFGELGQ